MRLSPLAAALICATCALTNLTPKLLILRGHCRHARPRLILDPTETFAITGLLQEMDQKLFSQVVTGE
jgi:hypothetical protein